MELQLIVAIVRNEMFENVESRLKDMRVKGITVAHVRGYGEYTNYFNIDQMAIHTRIEIFADKSKVEEIVAAIMDAAHTDFPGDGIVAVLPVEKLYHIRTKSIAQPDTI
jgi:nitrogen regulatory protein P-II 1